MYKCRKTGIVLELVIQKHHSQSLLKMQGLGVSLQSEVHFGKTNVKEVTVKKHSQITHYVPEMFEND